jgi:hypothetical protein
VKAAAFKGVPLLIPSSTKARQAWIGLPFGSMGSSPSAIGEFDHEYFICSLTGGIAMLLGADPGPDPEPDIPGPLPALALMMEELLFLEVLLY